MIKDVFLARALNQQQRVLVESQQLAAAAPEYVNAWTKLAESIYRNSRQDPAFEAVLKKSGVEIRSDSGPAPAATAPAPATAPMPSVPPKAPGTP
jgi:hypothetical protein